MCYSTNEVINKAIDTAITEIAIQIGVDANVLKPALIKELSREGQTAITIVTWDCFGLPMLDLRLVSKIRHRLVQRIKTLVSEASTWVNGMSVNVGFRLDNVDCFIACNVAGMEVILLEDKWI